MDLPGVLISATQHDKRSPSAASQCSVPLAGQRLFPRTQMPSVFIPHQRTLTGNYRFCREAAACARPTPRP